MEKYISKNILLSKQMEHKTWKKTMEIVEGFFLIFILLYFFKLVFHIELEKYI